MKLGVRTRSTKHGVRSAQHGVLSTQHGARSTQHLVQGGQYFVRDTKPFVNTWSAAYNEQVPGTEGQVRPTRPVGACGQVDAGNSRIERSCSLAGLEEQGASNSRHCAGSTSDITWVCSGASAPSLVPSQYPPTESHVKWPCWTRRSRGTVRNEQLCGWLLGSLRRNGV